MGRPKKQPEKQLDLPLEKKDGGNNEGNGVMPREPKVPRAEMVGGAIRFTGLVPPDEEPFQELGYQRRGK